jgi:hypothetical protein
VGESVKKAPRRSGPWPRSSGLKRRESLSAMAAGVLAMLSKTMLCAVASTERGAKHEASWLWRACGYGARERIRKPTVNRTRIIWVCSALAVVALGLLAWLYESSLGPTYSDAGTDFGLEGNGVRVAFTFTPKKLRPGDSLDVVIKLGNIPGIAPNTVPPGLANEAGGTLSGLLVAPDDCKVEPKDQIVLPTTGLSLSEMEWHWIVDCATEGRKTFVPTLTFIKNGGQTATGGSSDAVAYRGYLSVTESRSLTQIVVGGLSAVFLAVIGVLVSYLLRQRSAAKP